MDYNAGTAVNFADGFTVTVGKAVAVNAVGGSEPVSGAVPVGPSQVGVVVSAYIGGTPIHPIAKIKLLAYGTSNEGRIITVAAEHVAD